MPDRISEAEAHTVCERLLGRTPSLAESQAASLDALLARMVASDEFARRAARLLPPDEPFVNLWAEGLEDLSLPPGSRSRNGFGEVGHHGMVMLNEGTNGPLGQYEGVYPLPDEWEDGWRRAHAHRSEVAARLGVTMQWLVVPDKIAAMPHVYARPPRAGRRPVQRLMADLALPILYPLEEVRALGLRAYRPADTHLGPAGTRAVAAALAAALGAPAPARTEDLPFDEILHAGDVGKYFSPRIHEILRIYRNWPARVVASNEAELHPRTHFGRRTVTEYAQAPDPRCCVVFGDSYSHMTPPGVARRVQGLAWWLATIFREVHFCWAPMGWDTGYVERAAADVVVCQGAERFAVRPPHTEIAMAAIAVERGAEHRRDEVAGVFSRDDEPSEFPGMFIPPPTGAVTAEQIDAVYAHLLDRRASAHDVAAQLTAASLGEVLDRVLGSYEFLGRVRSTIAPEDLHVNVWTPELARFAPAPGKVSDDGAVEVGEQGMLLPRRLQRPWTPPDGWLESWQRAWEAHSADCREWGAEVAWALVPDKATVLGPGQPVDEAARLLVENVRPVPLYPVAALAALGSAAYWPTDSRPSTAGARAIAAALLSAVAGPDLPPLRPDGEVAFVIGDLGEHFRPNLGDVRPRAPRLPACREPGRRRCHVIGAADDVAAWVRSAFEAVSTSPTWPEPGVVGAGDVVLVVVAADTAREAPKSES